MKLKIKNLIVSSLSIFLFISTNLIRISALENEYISLTPLSNDEISKLLETYEYVTVYNNQSARTSGTHSTYSVKNSSTSNYAFVNYHPNSTRWSTATGYSISSSKTVSFNIAVTFTNYDGTASIKIGAAASSTTTYSESFELTDADKVKVNKNGYRTRLGVYAKVKREVWHYKVYDNASGALINEFDQPYVTTWDAEGIKNEVDYKIRLKKPS